VSNRASMATRQNRSTLVGKGLPNRRQQIGRHYAGSKNQANPLKRRGRMAWFFMRFRGPQALKDNIDGRPFGFVKSGPD
jgi:hypothetical protein